MVEKPNDIMRPAPGDFENGTRIGRYRLDGVVGRGGMGTVYRAFDEDTKRNVAVKILKPGLDEALHERFLVECEAEAKIRHPHVMPVYDRGTYLEDRLYFVMELVYEPITLTDVVEANLSGQLGQRWPRLRPWASVPRLVQDVFLPICEGVDAANVEYGFLHRDLKPDNVLIDVRTRRAYLIDFGICHKRGVEVEGRKLIGTPRFLSPEQAHGRIDEHTDVWGLGALLYYILTGRPPIDASSPMRTEERKKRVAELQAEEDSARQAGDENRAAELGARRTALEDPSFRTVDDMIRDARSGRYAPLPDHVPAEARAIVNKAMAVEPTERYATAGDMAEDLRAWVSGTRVQALVEQSATGAAVLAAQRTVRRHVVTALLLGAGLLIGLVFGAKLLSGENEGTVARVADVLTDVGHLEAEVKRIADLPPDSDGAAIAWRAARSRMPRLESRIGRLAEGPERADAKARFATLVRRMARPVLALQGGAGRTWNHRDMLKRDMSQEGIGSFKPEGMALPPGPYWLESRRILIPVRIPTHVGDKPLQVTVDLGQVPRKIPDGMTWIPPGPPQPGAPALPGFLIGVCKVKYFEYSEWIAELEVEEIAARLPEHGFEEDRTTPGYYIVDPDYEGRPVVGIRPEDAAAYAAWRAEIDRAPIGLPTEAEWRRAAGGGELTPSYAAFFTPLTVGAEGITRAEESPYNVEALLSQPPEIVRKGTAAAFLVKGARSGLGVPPTQANLAESTAADGDTRVEAGFRLVQRVR